MDADIRRARILDAVDYVVSDGIKAWDTIEPLAGFFFPEVKSEIEAELRLRGRDPLTGTPTPVGESGGGDA